MIGKTAAHETVWLEFRSKKNDENLFLFGKTSKIFVFKKIEPLYCLFVMRNDHDRPSDLLNHRLRPGRR
jgi:hypothetical protein